MQLTYLDQRRAAAVLLPLAGGLAVAAVAQLSVPAVILPVNVAVLVLLGAVLPERPWRTAVLAEAPDLAGADRDERRAEGAGGVGPSASDPGLFATKARRGAFLIVLFTFLATCNGVLAERWGDEADRLARQRAEEIRTALSGRTPQSLQQSLLDRAYGGDSEPLPGGPYRQYQTGPEEFRASAEVRSGLESRCIRVRVGADAVVHTEIEDSGC